MNYLTFETLRRVNLSRANRWHKNGLEEWSLSDWCVALAGEVGELCNEVKKLNRERDSIEQSSKRRINIAEELADIQLYLDLVAQRAGVNLEDATIVKFNKVSKEMSFPERL